MFSATFLGLLKNLTNKLDFGNWNYAVWISYYLTSESFTFFYWDMYYKWKFIFFIYNKPYQNQVALIHLLFIKPCPGKSLQFLQFHVADWEGGSYTTLEFLSVSKYI